MLAMIDEFDIRADNLSAELREALATAFDKAVDGIDVEALTAAIESGDEAAIIEALNVDEGLQSALDSGLNGAFFYILLGGFVVAMRSFASRHGARVNTADQGAQLRTEVRRTVIEPMARRAYEAAETTIGVLVAAGLNSRAIAEIARESIRLTPDQARSVAYLRRAFHEAANIRDRNGDVEAPIAHNAAVAIRRHNAPHLSAAQRSALAKALTVPLRDYDVRATMDRHIRALSDFRRSVIARQEAIRIIHAGEYQAFRQSKANRTLARSARRFWITMGDERVRHDHSMVPTMNAEGVDVGEPFQTPLGPMLYPPLEANCRCRISVRVPNLAA